MTTTTTLLQELHTDGAYGFNHTTIIIDHAKHGRLLLTQGYGGENTLEGGAVRWKHGLAVKLEPTDTFDTVIADMVDYGPVTLEQSLKIGNFTVDRELLDWSGTIVESVAKSALG